MKVTHWVNLVCMALLIFTGFLIHFPFWAGLTGVARGVHVFCGMLLVVNCILRIIFAALTFFPALALGPIAEHLTLWA